MKNTKKSTTAYRVTVQSYKTAQHYKKDYVRLGGKFERFEKGSSNHKRCTIIVGEGDEFDCRASAYREGITRFDAHECQSWAKFEVTDKGVQALDFDGAPIPLPHWVTVTPLED